MTSPRVVLAAVAAWAGKLGDLGLGMEAEFLFCLFLDR